MVRSGRNSSSSEILCMSSLPASIKRIRSKTTEKKWRHHFPKIVLNGAFCCHGNQRFDPICPKTLCSPPPPPPHSSHYKSMGAFCCHGHQSFDPICLKTLCSLSPPPLMLNIKFDQDWPTGLRDIQVRMCKIFDIQGQVTPK